MATQVASADAQGAPTIDQAKMGAFMSRALGDMTGWMLSVLCALGDRLGLFTALAAGPATSDELAARAGVGARYAREWLSALASAGYIEYDAASGRFTLPVEHALVLAFEGGPAFLGGACQQMAGLARPLDLVTRAFREGGGVAEEAYGDDLRQGMERMSATWLDHLLVQAWLPGVDGVTAALARGARVADVGCGSGRALVALARAFPTSRFVGYDASAAAIARARASAEAAGVANRVRFERREVRDALPGAYDLITTFDALHDFAWPGEALRAIRAALAPGGTYLLLESNCSERLEENAGPVGTILYGTSLLYCLPTALARADDALGTLGLPETRIRALCAEAGLRHVRRVPIQHPFNALYEIRPA